MSQKRANNLALFLDIVIEFWPGSSLESPLQLLTTDLRWTPHWWSLQRSRHALINSAFTLLAKLVEVGLTGEMLEDSILLHKYVLKLLSNKHVHPIIKIIQLKWVQYYRWYYNSQLSCHFNCTSLTGMCLYQFNMLKTIKKMTEKLTWTVNTVLW